VGLSRLAVKIIKAGVRRSALLLASRSGTASSNGCI
jgi:hypothetical protein